METILKQIILFSIVIGCVKCISFKCINRNTPCILLELDAKLHIARNNSNETVEVDISKGTVQEDKCSCGSTSQNRLTVKLPSGEHLQFIFNSDLSTDSNEASNDVDMTTVYDFIPKVHFTNATESETQVSSSSIILGGKRESFLCKNTEDLQYSSQYQLPYDMYLEIKNLHVQAYNIENGKYSKAKECEADFSTAPVTTGGHNTEETTHHDTTQPHTMTSHTHTMTSHTTPATHTSPETTRHRTTITTEPHQNMTTTEPSNITSTPSHFTTQTTSSPSPIPIVPKYGVKDLNGQYYCIVLKGDLQLEIPYTEEGGKATNLKISVPRNVTVTGSCSLNGTNTTQNIALDFFGDWSLTLTFGLTDGYYGNLGIGNNEQVYSVEEITLHYVLDEHFYKPEKEGQNFTLRGKPTFDTFKSSSKGSYLCNTWQSVGVENAKLDIQNFQYLAFGESDTEDFPKTGVTECAADTPATTLAPTAAPSKNHTGAIVGGLVGGVALVVILLGGFMYFRKQKAKSRQYDEL